MVKIICDLASVEARANSREAAEQPVLGVRSWQTLLGVICVLTVIIFILFGLLVLLWCSAGKVLPQMEQDNSNVASKVRNTSLTLKWTNPQDDDLTSIESLEMICSIKYVQENNYTVACSDHNQQTKLTLAKLQGYCNEQSTFQMTTENFPWLALLINSRGDVVCDGTLISDRYVLTAANCLSNEIATIRLGQHNSGNCECHIQTFEKESDVIHAFYDSEKMTNDIALIKLNSSAKITSSYVQPICLPLANVALDTSKELFITESNPKTHKTMTSSVTLLNNRECKNKTSAQLDDRNLCVKDDRFIGSGAVLHSFDKNSSAVIQYGIAIFGGSDEPGVFLKVSIFIDWILRHSQ